jgi:hypothetical protein
MNKYKIVKKGVEWQGQIYCNESNKYIKFTRNTRDKLEVIYKCEICELIYDETKKQFPNNFFYTLKKHIESHCANNWWRISSGYGRGGADQKIKEIMGASPGHGRGGITGV